MAKKAPSQVPSTIQNITSISTDDAQRLQLLGQVTSLDLPQQGAQPLVGDTLARWCRAKAVAHEQSRVELGVGLALRKRELGHGQFGAWLADVGINHSTANVAMSAAELFFSVAPETIEQLGNLPQRKITPLAGLSGALVDDLFGDGSLDDIDSMRPKDIQQIVKLRKDLVNEQQRRSDAEATLAHERRCREGTTNAGWKPLVGQMRREATIQGELAANHIDQLLTLAAKTVDVRNFDLSDSDRIAVGARLMQELEQLVPEIDAALAMLHTAFPKLLEPGASLAGNLLLEEELDSNPTAEIIAQRNVEQQGREVEAHNAVDGRRGRPRKTPPPTNPPVPSKATNRKANWAVKPTSKKTAKKAAK